MEQNQTTSLFSLSIDPVTKAHLSETARWGRFLAIVGMVFMALMVVFGIYFSTLMSTTMSEFGEYGGRDVGPGIGVTMAVMYVIIAVIFFFPCLYLLRFANKMRISLAGNDQQALNSSFQNLKICLRFVGIVTIIMLVLFGISLVFGILGAAAFS